MTNLDLENIREQWSTARLLKKAPGTFDESPAKTMVLALLAIGGIRFCTNS